MVTPKKSIGGHQQKAIGEGHANWGRHVGKEKWVNLHSDHYLPWESQNVTGNTHQVLLVRGKGASTRKRKKRKKGVQRDGSGSVTQAKKRKAGISLERLMGKGHEGEGGKKR